MRRRPPAAATAATGSAEHLFRFDPADWPTEGADDFERYANAFHRWRDARNAWADEHGWEGDATWDAECHRAILDMPDAPFDPADL